MSGSAVQQQLRDFTTELLEHGGGAVDWPDAGGEGTAVVPRELAALLHRQGDSFALSARSVADGLHVSLTSEFLDLAGNVLEAVVPRVGSFSVPEAYLKRGQLDDAVNRAYSWLNARVKLLGNRAVEVEYHTWWFHASLRSEDTWEGGLSVTLNAQTLAELAFPNPLELFDLDEAVPSHADVFATCRPAGQRVLQHTLKAAQAFLERMDSRRERDQRRLRDYYNALLRESKATNRRTTSTATPEEIAAKRRVVQLELQRKLAELDERYHIAAELRPIAVARTAVTALAVDLDVQRRQTHRKHVIYWNPLLKQFEPFTCSGCGTATFSVAFTNDDVQPLCAKCSA